MPPEEDKATRTSKDIILYPSVDGALTESIPHNGAQAATTESDGKLGNGVESAQVAVNKTHEIIRQDESANIAPGIGEEGHQTGGWVRRLSVENTDKNAKDEAWLLGIPGSVCFAPSGLASLITRLRILLRTALASAPTTIFSAIAFLKRRKLRATTPDTTHFVEHPTSFTGNGTCSLAAKAVSAPSFSIAFTIQMLSLAGLLREFDFLLL
eukprot:CAMPEP_0185260994 /NCGR_PEP_ID=MMETSP1359-20130426/9489_1 /TAXON_ID=552665 /ORGANISM="Bigelowiella longifila, Strain CCMP242" /LENGTH=210 /DNA_ID=CAMNT_0027847467 /DNA_START=206 /DNA_END=837 /DNA_ORIENTATION=-